MIRACVASLFLTFAAAAAPAPDAFSPVAIFQQADRQGNAVLLILQQGRHHCPAGQQRAVLLNTDHYVWVGCYARDGDEAHILFEDGDKLTVVIKQA
jgi:hypothetical protein